MLNLDDIVKRLERLSLEIEKLENRRQLNWDDFSDDPDIQDVSAYSFIVAAQTCMDIAAHIIAATGLRKPQDNKDLFFSLAEAGVFPKIWRNVWAT